MFQCTRLCFSVHVCVSVYMAVYLDSLTHTDLCEKIASLFSIETSQVIEMFVQGPSGIHILITDDVRPELLYIYMCVRSGGHLVELDCQSRGRWSPGRAGLSVKGTVVTW